MFINWREQTIRAPIRVHEVTSHLSGYGETCTMPGNLSRAERIFHLWHRIGAQKKKKKVSDFGAFQISLFWIRNTQPVVQRIVMSYHLY